MKLNRDCMKDILLYLEDNLDYYQPIKYEDLFKKLNTELSRNEVYYSLRKLVELRCIIINPDKIDALKEVTDITLTGYNYIQEIRAGREFKFNL